jgi:hypothetical protein
MIEETHAPALSKFWRLPEAKALFGVELASKFEKGIGIKDIAAVTRFTKHLMYVLFFVICHKYIL